MAEWPQERRHRASKPAMVSPRLADIPDGVLREAIATGAFLSLSQAVIDGFNAGAEPKVQRPELSARLQSEDFVTYGESVRDALLALACADAFRQAPSREMWEFLWSLTWDSSSLPTLLEQAMISASADTAFRNSFFATAHHVVRHALENPGCRAIAKKNDSGANQREHWRKHPQLSALWRNNFSQSFDPFGRDDDHVLSIVVQIDTVEFIRLLEVFDYPDPVANALTWCGARWKFEYWEAMVTAAPKAFDEEGCWNGSLILPLLLSIAREQFQFPLRKDATDEQVSDATAEIANLTLEVTRVIAHRPDALWCTTRWGAWLIRNAIPAVSANAIPHPSNAKSQGFIDVSLLDALISETPTDRWSPGPAPGAEPWEPWCHLAVGVTVALSRKVPMPSPSGFLDDWDLSPESWSSGAGQTLKARAMPFEMGTPRADGYGPRLLALSVIEAGSADTVWAKFWNSTATLREIVEFGDVDENDGVGWQGRSEASQLLILQFSVGLMMLDHLILPQRTLPYTRQSAMQGLLPLLDEAIREMAAIDQLNGKFWIEAKRHLAVRRATWLSGTGLRQTNADVVALDPETKPTLADFIRDSAGDTEGLLTLVQVALLNHVEKSALVDAFKEARVDLGAEIEIAMQLLEISPRAANFGQAQIDAASELLSLA
jgi:hypothetical protein